MYLKKKSICNHYFLANVFSSEMMSEKLLMISLKSELDDRHIPSYWRIGDAVNIPPLEIGIDCDIGCISDVVAFVDLTSLKREKQMHVNVSCGTVMIDTSVFHHVNDFVDVHQKYFSFLSPNKITFLFEEHVNISAAYRSGKLEVYLNASDQIVGIGIDLEEDRGRQGDGSFAWSFVSE